MVKSYPSSFFRTLLSKHAYSEALATRAIARLVTRDFFRLSEALAAASQSHLRDDISQAGWVGYGTRYLCFVQNSIAHLERFNYLPHILCRPSGAQVGVVGCALQGFRYRFTPCLCYVAPPGLRHVWGTQPRGFRYAALPCYGGVAPTGLVSTVCAPAGLLFEVMTIFDTPAVSISTI